MSTFTKVGIVGTGVMGSGIVQTCIQAGHTTVMVGRRTESIDRAMAVIEKGLSRLLERGQISEQDKSDAIGRLETTLELDALRECDIVIETIVEDLEVKKELFGKLDTICPPDTILASDTATLPISEIARATNRPDRVVGLHILIPAPASKMVEMVRGELSSQDTLDRAKAFCESLGKTVVTCSDSPGFIINRLLAPYLLEAVRLVEQGVASNEDIDTCMQVGTGYPMGPLRLLDNVGLDQFHDLATSLHRLLNDPKYDPPRLLTDMVEKGQLGRKSGQGFYTWT